MEKDNINEEIADLLSKVRTDPKFLIPELKARLKLFKGNTIYEPGEIGLVTNEGPKAVIYILNIYIYIYIGKRGYKLPRKTKSTKSFSME